MNTIRNLLCTTDLKVNENSTLVIKSYTMLIKENVTVKLISWTQIFSACQNFNKLPVLVGFLTEHCLLGETHDKDRVKTQLRVEVL